jgi:hypothetical protein
MKRDHEAEDGREGNAEKPPKKDSRDSDEAIAMLAAAAKGKP